jgi:hypothetical protein
MLDMERVDYPCCNAGEPGEQPECTFFHPSSLDSQGIEKCRFNTADDRCDCKAAKLNAMSETDASIAYSAAVRRYYGAEADDA